MKDAIALSLALCLAAACSRDIDQPSGALCPTPQTLTYDNFGKAFVQSYCLRCHGAAVSGAARMGAPGDHNFDAVSDIRSLAEHIDQYAGGGPAAVNTEMPPSGAKPGEAERRKLGEWLACGAP